MRKLSVLLILAVFSVSCSKDKDAEPATLLSESDIKLHYDEDHQFTLKKGTGTVSGTTFNWSTPDTIIGKVDKNGKFTGKRIGQTSVKAVSTDGKTTLESKVTIDPYSTLCVEPVVEFKSTPAAVKAKEKRALAGEDTISLVYKGENEKIRGILYGFDKNVLEYSAILITESKAVVDETGTFLLERYDYAGQEDGIFYFTDGKVVIGYMDEQDLGYIALYYPYSESGLRTSASFRQNIQAAFKARLQDAKAKFKGL